MIKILAVDKWIKRFGVAEFRFIIQKLRPYTLYILKIYTLHHLY